MNPNKLLPILLLLLFPSAVATAQNSLSASDVEKIREVHKMYEQVWLKGDADGVRALFTQDSVLFPPHGDRPRVGRKGLNEFWFPPDAPPTQITKLLVVPQDIGGNGEIAYAWGTDEVAWTTIQGGKPTATSHKGIFLNVLKKQADGQWKISHHMWDDAIAGR